MIIIFFTVKICQTTELKRNFLAQLKMYSLAPVNLSNIIYLYLIGEGFRIFFRHDTTFCRLRNLPKIKAVIKIKGCKIMSCNNNLGPPKFFLNRNSMFWRVWRGSCREMSITMVSNYFVNPSVIPATSSSPESFIKI